MNYLLQEIYSYYFGSCTYGGSKFELRRDGNVIKIFKTARSDEHTAFYFIFKLRGEGRRITTSPMIIYHG